MYFCAHRFNHAPAISSPWFPHTRYPRRSSRQLPRRSQAPPRYGHGAETRKTGRTIAGTVDWPGAAWDGNACPTSVDLLPLGGTLASYTRRQPSTDKALKDMTWRRVRRVGLWKFSQWAFMESQKNSHAENSKISSSKGEAPPIPVTALPTVVHSGTPWAKLVIHTMWWIKWWKRGSK